MKHTELTLSKHPQVRSIIDPKTVICVCGKRFRNFKKRKLCIGLNDEKVKLYLRRVGFITTFGGAPPSEIVA
ncbi:unnamed protein product [Rhizophagus irregularis]|uniref:Uncharacterized protein n=1 Tax=Rhizophagus irregularis TaxID=588596 RepID=A0A915ZBY5_9GLOM|nr:unnamed protein product [Rhizophagus irregularis]